MSTFTTLSERVKAFENSDVYPVISSEFCARREPLFILEKILAGGAKVVQIREKNMDDNSHLKLLKQIIMAQSLYAVISQKSDTLISRM